MVDKGLDVVTSSLLAGLRMITIGSVVELLMVVLNECP